jgi:hypothetical protein
MLDPGDVGQGLLKKAKKLPAIIAPKGGFVKG